MNPSAIPMSDAELGLLLVSAAQGYDLSTCPDDGCDGCKTFVAVWWDTFYRLTREEQDNVTDALNVTLIPVPFLRGVGLVP